MAAQPWLPPTPSDLLVTLKGDDLIFRNNLFSFSVPASRWPEIERTVKELLDEKVQGVREPAGG